MTVLVERLNCCGSTCVAALLLKNAVHWIYYKHLPALVIDCKQLLLGALQCGSRLAEVSGILRDQSQITHCYGLPRKCYKEEQHYREQCFKRVNGASS
ncbi:hypothetical protein Y032_0021g398 [Ancylostoma ceylanicum]|uniref:Uncharacterized protein n=1 Tax=Ancylostoma ceylanicum TaxID=53326 RepID=A0A016UZX5_9BILA|nr:hypothetical protein Y032_0021g398 [Ancylostoma ceylanicum]